MNYYTGENEKDYLEWLEPRKCEECKTPMEKIEDVSARISYEWNNETKEYKKIDTDYYGDCYTTFKCSKCGEEIEE